MSTFQGFLIFFSPFFPLTVNIQVFHKEESIIVGADHLVLNDTNLLWAFCSHLALCWTDHYSLSRLHDEGIGQNNLCERENRLCMAFCFPLFIFNVPPWDKLYETSPHTPRFIDWAFQTLALTGLTMDRTGSEALPAFITLFLHTSVSVLNWTGHSYFHDNAITQVYNPIFKYSYNR